MKAVAVVLALAAAPLLASAQTIQNPSFSDGAAGWTLTDGSQGSTQSWAMSVPVATSPDDISGKDSFWHTYSLTTGISKLPNGARGISQSISGFTVGQSYQLTFYEAASNHSNSNFAADLWWQVMLGDQSLNSTTIAAPAAQSATGWQKVVLTFTATAATETLSFLAHASAGVAPEPQLLLDGLSLTPVSAVPEPAQWALLAAGGMALFVLNRRRNNRR